MKTALKVLLFLLSFQLEVRVKAAEPGQAFAVKKVFHFTQKDLKIHAPIGATLEETKSGDWKVLDGDLWVEKAQHKNFQTLYAVTEGKSGEFWISAHSDKTWIRNFSAVLSVTLRDGKKIQIPPGFQMWAAGFNSNAEVEYGMIQPIDMREQIPQWYAIYPDGVVNFQKKIEALKSSWGDTTATASQIYKAQALRKIASVQEQERAASARKQKAEAESRRIRQLYLQRTFER